MESSSEEAKGITGGEAAQFYYPPINHHRHHNQIRFQSPPPAEMLNEMIPHSSSIWKPGSPNPAVNQSTSAAGDADDLFRQFDTTVDQDRNHNSPPPPQPPRNSSQGGGQLSLSLSSLQQRQMAAAAMLHSGGGNNSNNNDNRSLYEFELRRSRYLGAAKELLNEFCSLASTKQDATKQPLKSKPWDVDGGDDDDDNAATPSSSRIKPSIGSHEFLELQKRKTKLYSLLEEVDRKYRHYCDQMKAVVSAFESVAGVGAAGVYSALASKAMSRHFRCLRDGIVAQIQATRKAMGEKDPVAPGTTRGETPRLKVIDQTIRQHKAFQQMNMMETHPWRPQRGLPERSVSVLRAWLFEHFLHPYPSDVDKHILARQTGLSRSQASLHPSFLFPVLIRQNKKL
ncbi:Homeobox protein BEL1 homolog [Linum grandiflorum]